MRRRPRLAVFKLASCDGCQLSLLDCEDELLAVAGAVDIVNFLEASRAVEKGPYDVALVEGSITTPARRRADPPDPPRRHATSSRSAPARRPAASRPCATTEDVAEFTRAVYASPQYIETLNKSTPDRRPRLRRLRAARLPDQQDPARRGPERPPERPQARRPDVQRLRRVQAARDACVMVAHGTPCLGPVTQAGCGALCPSYARGCYGCFGPMETPNTSALAAGWTRLGVDTAASSGRSAPSTRAPSLPAGERDP